MSGVPDVVGNNDERRNGGDVRIREGTSPGTFIAKLQCTEPLPDHSTFRVVVVDDSIVPRTAARAMLASSSELTFVGEASSGSEAIPLIERLRPDIVLMDVHMPHMDGPSTAQTVLTRYPALKIVAWTVSESSDDLLKMMRAGCAGYLLKDAGPSELERALLAAIRSESPVPRRMIPDVLRRAADSTPRAPTQSPVRLTPREQEVLRGIAKGQTTKRLAQDLGLKVPSVETHLRNIFKKLGATNRGEAVSASLRLGLIQLSDL